MSGRRGRPRKRNADIYLEVLLKHKNDIVLDKGRICGKKCEIWSVVSNELLEKKVLVSQSSLYGYVSCNIDNVRKKLTSEEDFKTVQQNILLQKELENQEAQRDSDVFNNSLRSCKKVKIHFSKNEMDSLIVKKSVHNTRAKMKEIKNEDREQDALKVEKWQEEMTKKLWDKARVKCAFNISNHKICLTSGTGTFSGSCKCGATIDGKITDLGSEIATVSCLMTIVDVNCGNRNLRNPNAEIKTGDSERKIPVLKNGNIYDLAPIEIENLIVTLSNTCTFDSIFQLVLSCYMDEESTRVMVNQLGEHILFFKLIHQVAETGITHWSYVQRAKILLPLFRRNEDQNTDDCIIVMDSTKKNRMKNKGKAEKNKKVQTLDGKNKENMLLDCAGYADITCAYVIKDVYSLKELLECNKCLKQREYNQHILSIPADYLRSEEMTQQFSDLVKREDSKCTQNNCGGIEKSTIAETAHFIFLEVQEYNGQDTKIKLNKIGRNLKIAETTYALQGIVHFIPPVLTRHEQSSVGHYVTISLRKNGQWVEYNDLKPSKAKRKSSKFESMPHLLLYAKS
ncbi:uncharacterized protein LOC122510897 [Leptopilina heterotoma]|uniref:uncharacterized protein LOC122510897 n=1 Tax=Leptopilina heterotoma TaxID=63436 RepID=UPI001CA834DC|nr:uncharacterized protein LOC122510897 [Leptopilina heterotoma]